MKNSKFRILRHNVHFGHTGELSQLENIILDILSQLQTLYKEHSVKERGWLFLRHSAWLSLILSLLQAGLWKVIAPGRSLILSNVILSIYMIRIDAMIRHECACQEHFYVSLTMFIMYASLL